MLCIPKNGIFFFYSFIMVQKLILQQKMSLINTKNKHENVNYTADTQEEMLIFFMNNQEAQGNCWKRYIHIQRHQPRSCLKHSVYFLPMHQTTDQEKMSKIVYLVLLTGETKNKNK